MKNLTTSLELAFESFRAHKIRTSLAVLGVTIGIASIIVVFSAGEGIKGLLSDQVESFGVDIIQVEIKVPTSKKGLAGEQQSAISLLQGAQVTTLDLDDLEDVSELPNVKDVYGLLLTQESVVYRNEIRRVLIWSTGASFINVDQATVAEGRFFSKIEDKSLAQVAVLGSGIKDKLFGDSDPLDKTVKVRGIRFRIIGVMEERGAIFTFNFDDFVYVPVQTMQKRIMGSDFLHNILAQVDDVELIDETAEEMRVILRSNHDIDPPEEIRESIFDTGKDDFRVTSMIEALEIFDTVFLALTLILLAIVAVSLVVGGVGVMNVMYVIVNERTPEIGLRKAVGARYNDIMTQFLVESVLVTLMGGVVGILFGMLISYGISVGAGAAGFAWHFTVPLIAFITALLFSIVFGIMFGMYPARKAARMDPIEALRYNL